MTKEELQKVTVEKHNDSTVTLTGEIPYAYLEDERAKAVAHLGKDMTIPGFRKGNVPEKVLVERMGEMAILSEMAERALGVHYPHILTEHKIDAIGYPKMEITKLAKDNPLGFKAVVAVYPEVTLPDYTKIAKDINAKKESDEVTDKEVEEQINDVLRQKAAYERLQKKAASQKGETHTHEDGTVHEGPAHDSSATISDEHTHDDTHEQGNAEIEADKPIEDIKDLPIPELTDDLVKTFGQPGQFENVANFKAKIREHLVIQKRQDNASKHRSNLTDAIVEKTEVQVPQVMIDAELSQMFAQMEEDLTRAQLNMEDYLGHIKKTRGDLKTEWSPAAEKRAKLQLVLNEISKTEKITADEARVNDEVAALLAQYKDADKNRVRIYVTSMLQNEEVLKKLESL